MILREQAVSPEDAAVLMAMLNDWLRREQAACLEVRWCPGQREKQVSTLRVGKQVQVLIINRGEWCVWTGTK